MAKRSDHRGKTDAHVESFAERQKKAIAAREEKLALFRATTAKRAEKAQAAAEAAIGRPIRDLASHERVLLTVPFHEMGQPRQLQAGEAYRRLAALALTNINDAQKSVVLCWPDCGPSPAVIAALLALADCGATTPIKVDGFNARSAPLGLRALIYPYARTVHRPLRHVYVDKGYLSRLHLEHQIRSQRRDEDPAFADYHKTVARVKSLDGRAIDGRQYNELHHPTLDELMPSGPCQGTGARSKLLWNVNGKTDLKEISRSGEADDPARARFYLFGLKAGENVKRSLFALKTPPDIVLADLGRVGRNRLGPDWHKHAKIFFEELESRFGAVPALVLTDDPWSFDKVRFDVLGKPSRRKSAAIPAPSNVLLAYRSEVVEADSAPPQDYVTVRTFEFHTFSGDVAATIRQLRAARKNAQEAGDSEAASRLAALIAIVRRCAALPSSLRAFGEFIEQEVGPMAAADILTNYRPSSAISDLAHSVGAWAQTNRAELLALTERVRGVWSRTEMLTPIAPLLKEMVGRLVRASSRTAVLFEKDMLADFAQHALSNDAEIGELVQGRIDKGMLYFLDRAGLEDLERLPSKERNHIKTLIVVSPSRSAALSLLARPWLPDKVIVLADSESLESMVQDVGRLMRHEELSALKPRMEEFSKRAAETLEGATKAKVVFDPQSAPIEDIDIPFGGIVNLAGRARAGQTLLRIEIEGGQVIIARPGTRLVVQDRSGTISRFVEVDAKDIDIGDRVCVIGDAFLEMARPLLNITARAAEEIRDYHRIVIDRFEKIPGRSRSERLTNIVAAMGMPDVAVQRAAYWIDLQDQVEAPLHEVVPHAPQDMATFIAFMKALSVTEATARRFWTWAVIAQRASRLRAAFAFHDAYRSILVDGSAAQADHPERVADIRKLRAAAENFIGAVSGKIELREEHARA